jgi:serine protease
MASHEPGKSPSVAPSGPVGQTAADFVPRVVVKFHDSVVLPYTDDVEEELDRIGPWTALAAKFPGIDVKRVFTSLTEGEIQELAGLARERDPTYDPPERLFLTYFAVECPSGVDPDAVAREFRGWDAVELVYLEGRPGPLPAVNPGNDGYFDQQGYIKPAPGGIGAEFAWTNVDPGGAGDEIGFVDLERGWALAHEDLLDKNGNKVVTELSNGKTGDNRDPRDHGTSVLGIVVSVDNDKGDVGVATHARARIVSEWRPSGAFDSADAILAAVQQMKYGDVLLLETQYWVDSNEPIWPIEVQDAVFRSIRLATALGIVVVEAAGTDTRGGHDLDAYPPDGSGPRMLNRCDSGFQDSGAVMVGGASSTVEHYRLSFSNYGNRVDCYAWGQNAHTLDTNPAGTATYQYKGDFGGTSSAAAIVAGAALVIQGIAKTELGWRFSPGQVRAVLSDPANGTRSHDPAVDKIGVMPDLQKILQDQIDVTPDVYIRDFVGDNGDPHTGSSSASPDVIVRAAEVLDAPTAFGEGSGTENSNTLSDPVAGGQDNFIYVRVRNRGGAAAADVTASVFWAPVATLLTPDLWTPVGAVTIPDVPSGDLLTVSEPITWEAEDIPAAGDYSFICLIGNAQDPAPEPAEFLNFPDFRRFIRRNNNVTRRSFNVVSPVFNVVSEPGADGAPADYAALSFLAPGMPNRSLEMQLDVGARLPRGSRLLLDAPASLIDLLQAQVPFDRRGDNRVWLPLNPFGRSSLGRLLFPARSRIDLRLLVHIPKGCRTNPYELFVRQLHEDEEIGRVTWRLVPPSASRTRGRRTRGRR